MSVIRTFLAVFGVLSMVVFAVLYWVLFVPTADDSEDAD